jgi:hypothetical protein
MEFAQQCWTKKWPEPATVWAILAAQDKRGNGQSAKQEAEKE